MTDVFSPKVFETPIRRRQFSLFSEGEATLSIMDSRGVNVDPDPDTLTVSVYRQTEEGEGLLIDKSTNWEKDGTGLYRFIIRPDRLQTPSLFRVVWKYEYAGHENGFTDHFAAYQHMPTWLTFSLPQRGLVENILWTMFDDLFDNVEGGVPAFAEEYQTRFGYEKVAQLMQIALNFINTTKQPLTRFSIGLPTGKVFPEKWYGLLLKATYVEVLKHFVRTYVEQPNITGGNVTRADRRDYMQRWQSILQDERKELDDMLKMFKKEQMGLGRPSILVAGGIYGSSSRGSSTWAAETRGARFYPTTYVTRVS